MPRPKGSKNLKPGDIVEVPKGETLAMLGNTIIFEKKKIDLLDATKPDLLSINNDVRSAIRETRKKVNEIINILNGRE